MYDQFVVSQNVATRLATRFVYVGLEIIIVKMDLIKTTLGLQKHKHSQILNPTYILISQIAEQFISDLQIDVKKEEEVTVTSGQSGKEDEIEIKNNLAADALNHENTHNPLLSELLETERKYVQDLEEVIIE